MSNLLKSKTFKVGGLVVAIAMMLSVGFAANTASAQTTTVVASGYTYSGVMKKGMSGPGISTLQAALNEVNMGTTIVVDGQFGPATHAAVVKFQLSKGLVGDGIVGPMTGAALAAATVGTITVPTPGLPAGCTSTAGYSTTTGVKCDSGSTLPAGCTSTAGYSPTTGAKCDGGSTASGPLEGGAGDISLDDKSTYNSEDVIAGDEDAKVMAFEVEADDGSDVEITSVKVEFVQSGAGNSDDMEDYMESVSIWMGSTKVGEADVDEFTDNGDYWSKSIALDGAVIDAGETEDFTVAVTAVNNLDSGDINDDAWEVDLLNVRFMDAEGVTTTETADAAETANGTYSQDFDFDELSTSGDLELQLSLGSGSPDASSVEVDDTTDTDVTMLEFKLKAEGSDMTIDSMLLSAVALDATLDTWTDMVSEISLEVDGDEIDSVSAYYDGVDDDQGDLLFNDLDFTIEEDDTVTFKVVANIREIAAGTGAAGTFDQGDSFNVTFTSAYLKDVTGTDQTDVEDENGDVVVAGDRTGSAIGETQTFYSTGVAVDMGTVTYESVTDSGNVTQVTYNIPVSITSFGDTRYIGLSVEEDTDASHATVTDGKALSYAFQASTAPATDLAAANTTAVESWSCSATIESGTGYRLDEGQATNCTLTVTLSGTTTTPGSYRVHLGSVETWTAAALNAGGATQLLTPAEDFQTAFKLLNS